MSKTILPETDASDGARAVLRVLDSRAGERMRRAALLYLEGVSLTRAAELVGFTDHANLWRFAGRHSLHAVHDKRRREHLEELQVLKQFERIHRKATSAKRKPHLSELVSIG